MTAQLSLTETRIQDFRTIKDLWMPIRTNLVLLGENNSGKTAFLSSLDVALGSTRAKEDDFRRDAIGGVAARFIVDLRFEPFVGDEFDDATTGVLGKAIQLQKHERAFFALRTKVELDGKRGEVTIRRAFLKGWERERAKAESLAEVATTVTREHRDLVTFNLLDARRDALEQLRNKRTFWGQIVSDLRLADAVRTDVQQTLAEVGRKLHQGSQVLKSLGAELEDIKSVVAHKGLDITVETLPSDVEDLIRSMDLVLTETGQTALPIAVQGMGIRSLSALLIFRAYVRAVLSTATGPGTLSIAAFEEPEAHLHPQAQRAVLGAIQKIPGQRIISTHSPYIASVADVFDIRVFRRDTSGTTVAWLDETPLPGAVKLSNEEREQFRRFVQRRHGEVLFARAVGLFEGDTEDAALPVLAKSLWPNGPDAHGISLINVGGAGNYKHLIILLNALRIPWAILSDGDQAGREGLKAAGKAINVTLDNSSPQVVFLPQGQDFESYLLSLSLDAQIQTAIAQFYGKTALADFRASTDGQQLPKNLGPRDYQSTGWERRLLHDFMDKNKGTYGASLADEILRTGKPVPLIETFFALLNSLVSP